MLHTLSIFPDLLSFSLLGITLLRLTLGTLLISRGNVLRATDKKFGYGFLVAGILLFVGLWTQPVALVATLLLAFQIKKLSGAERTLAIVLAILSFSFLVVGPGVLAIDLPL